MSEAHAVKGMEVKFHIFKASVLGRGEWSVSRTSPLYSWERKNVVEYLLANRQSTEKHNTYQLLYI
jgi:hypothetical protein